MKTYTYFHFTKIFTTKNSSRYSCELFAITFTAHLCGKLALDEGKRLGAVLINVLLVSIGVIAIAAVRIGGVAV
jgi:hypothetical protein